MSSVIGRAPILGHEYGGDIVHKGLSETRLSHNQFYWDGADAFGRLSGGDICNELGFSRSGGYSGLELGLVCNSCVAEGHTMSTNGATGLEVHSMVYHHHKRPSNHIIVCT